MRIAVDVMGGDLGPAVIVEGAINGARVHGVDIVLIGDEKEIRSALGDTSVNSTTIEVHGTSEVIDMHDHPAQAVRRKKDASMNVAMRMVKDGSADAMLSPGNSGAMMASALLNLGRIKGIDRPAITSGVPNARKAFTMMVDLGAVTDPKPLNMLQFAMMGEVYAETVVGLNNPTVGLLANGEEESKGNALVQKVHPMLKEMEGINFIGNVEGRDILTGEVDVVVADGFTGNVALKAIEGTASVLMKLLKEEITSTLPRKLAALALKPAFKAVAARLDSSTIGGAPLLGVAGVVIITHGSSNARAIENAVGVAKQAVSHDLNGVIERRVGTTEAAAASDGE